MSIKVKAKVIKTVGKYPNKQILGCLPIEPNESIQINKYNNFTVIDTSLVLSEGKEYTIEVEESMGNYGVQYILKSVPSFSMESVESITDDMELELLQEVTSPSLAKTINQAYPNYLRLILQGKKDEIDLNKIKGVKEYRHKVHCRLINEKFKYYYILEQNRQYNLDLSDCKKLCTIYPTVEQINDMMIKNPYYCLIYICNKPFPKVDKTISECRDDLKLSDIRAEFMALYILQQNEVDGSTYIEAKELCEYCMGIESKLVARLKDVAIKSDLIYYNEGKNTLAKMDTYLAECSIADFIKNKIKNSVKLDWDWTKFKKIKDGELTEEQSNVLKNFCEYSFSVLDAPSGCVDADTEFFNGKEWKKISEYQTGEKVLQYNKDGTTNLVIPYKYHKLPCEHLWHFETKYGINQTLSDEHNIVYINDRGFLKEISMKDMMERQNNNPNGFSGKFITSFNYDNKGVDLTDDEIKIMCAVICDGTFYYNQEEKESVQNRDSYMRCRFHIKKDRKKHALRKLFEESNTPYREKESSEEGYTDFYIQAPRREKEFSSYWYNCSQRQLQIICDNLMQWDGSINYTKAGTKRRRFSTTVKQTADFVQFAYTSCGHRASISVNDRRGREKRASNGKIYIDKTIEYTIIVTARILCKLSHDGRKNKVKTPITKYKTVDGYKYCFTVESHMLVLRRENRIFITGNCGKTSVLKAVLDMCDEYNYSYCCLAFTGKASARMKEQTGRETSTIHRRTLDGSIYEDVLVIDEYSMLSLELLNMIVQAIENPDIRIFFVGDSCQIQNLGLANPSKALLNSDIVPKCTLTHCFRFDEGGASYVSALTRQGKFYLTEEQCEMDRFTLGNKKDYTFIKSDGTTEQIVDEYIKLINKGIKPKDICVLTPYNKGDFGATRINNLIQADINPPKPNERYMKSKKNDIEIVLRKDDLIMNVKNDYNAINDDTYEILEWEDDLTIEDLPTVSIFNGQTGKILSINDQVLKAQIDGEIIVFDKIKCYNLLLSYATNPFKFQGSSCKYIINVILPQHKRLLDKQLLYTAQTRQEVSLIEIGDIDTIKEAVSKIGGIDKRDNLEELLNE